MRDANTADGQRTDGRCGPKPEEEDGVREREEERDAGIFLAQGEKDASDAGC